MRHQQEDYKFSVQEVVTAKEIVLEGINMSGTAYSVWKLFIED
jgi:hypothetical protein